jgi:hypothetical protein
MAGGHCPLCVKSYSEVPMTVERALGLLVLVIVVIVVVKLLLGLV